MGVSGAAYATVISQGVSGLLCLVYIIKKVDSLKMDKSDWQYDGHVAKLQISIGTSMAILQFSITAVGTIMVQAALNTLGSLAVAAFTAANKIEMLATQAFCSIGNNDSYLLCSEYWGGKISRIRQGFRATTIMAIIYSLIASALVMTVGKYMSILFCLRKYQ